jgi:hypothetical protein
VTSEILVHPAAWADCRDALRDAYERRAKDLGIRLVADEEPGSEGSDVVVLVNDGSFLPETFVLRAPCPAGRRGWEHVVRRELRLDDPCFT